MIIKISSDNQEIDSIMELWLQSTIKGHPFIEKQFWMDNYKIVREKYIPIADTYVYKDDNIIKGFISVLDSNFIGALFVNIDYQHQGIGSKLIEYAKGKYEHLKLAVYKKNINAVDFYIKNGFVNIKEQVDESTLEKEYIMVYNKK